MIQWKMKRRRKKKKQRVNLYTICIVELYTHNAHKYVVEETTAASTTGIAKVQQIRDNFAATIDAKLVCHL